MCAGSQYADARVEREDDMRRGRRLNRPVSVLSCALVVILVASCSGGTSGSPSSQSTTPQPSRQASTTGPPPSTSQATQSTPVITPSASNLADFFGSEFDASKSFCSFDKQNVQLLGDVLRVSYAAGSSAPSAGAPYGGAQLCEPFAGGTRTEATLSYQVRFPVGFQFVKGGKLPGIYGGKEPFSGGKHTSDGWSMRLMWRTGGAGEVYSYISTTSGYGDEYGTGNFTFAADGKWHTVSEHIVVNTPGNADGTVTLSYDGHVAITKTGLAITKTNTPAQGIFFSTFYGGHDKSWSPTTDQQLDFTGFKAG